MKKRKDGRYQSSVMITDPLTNKKSVYMYMVIAKRKYTERKSTLNAITELIAYWKTFLLIHG